MKKIAVFLNEDVQKIVKFLFFWHDGQSSAMYSVMSQLNAGKTPNKKEITDCIKEVKEEVYTDDHGEHNKIITLLKKLNKR